MAKTMNSRTIGGIASNMKSLISQTIWGKMTQQMVAIAAGKTAGLGTAVGASKSGVDRKLVDFVINKGKHNINLLFKIFENDLGKSVFAPELTALLWDLHCAGVALAQQQRRQDA